MCRSVPPPSCPFRTTGTCTVLVLCLFLDRFGVLFKEIVFQNWLELCVQLKGECIQRLKCLVQCEMKCCETVY